MLCDKCSGKFFVPRSSLGPESEILSQLRSPSPLSSSDVHLFSQKILEAEGDVKAYEAEVARLMSKITTLTSKAGMLRKNIGVARSLLSPIRRLPSEILCIVFGLATIRPRFSLTRAYKNPPFLSVCSRWRNVVLSHPSIWSSFIVEYPKSMDDVYYPAKNIRALELHLSRSKASPLTITFRFVEKPSSGNLSASPDMTSANELEDLLIAHSSRWKDLTFHGSLVSPELRLCKRIQNVEILPSLTHLSNLYGLPISVWSALVAKCPELFSLEISPSADACMQQSFNIRNLVTLVLKDQNLNGTLRIVERCPKLLSLKCIFGHAPLLHPENVRSLACRTLPLVEDLVLELIGDPANHLPPLFISGLSIPSLKSVTIQKAPRAQRSGEPPVDALSQFFSRSRCILTALSLRSMIISDTDTISLLRPLIHLTHLTVHEICNPPAETVQTHPPLITTRFLDRLHTYKSSHSADDLIVSTVLVPRLQHLELKAPRSSFDDSAFVEMVMSRWLPVEDYAGSPSTSVSGVECLKSVDVHVVGGRVDVEIWKQLDIVGVRVSLEEEV
ncbi:hypothetical protein D9758_008399 [Tetrapyrgos nigripes]|uniref:F-box domain-containing protein n=1 Tax=Tetrapyrgos nigripes TaxID=182062 RepID=A0A8H5LMZ5_9AGAR|nr:hypothetical protein D9758_008399 [Tetrapyrgos nigripes]